MQKQQWNGRRRRRTQFRRFRWDRLAIIVALLAGLVFGVVKLVSYGIDLVSARNASQRLQAVYHADSTEEVSPEVTPAQPAETPPLTDVPAQAVTPVPTVTAVPAVTAEPAVTMAPTISPIPRLSDVPYPNNASLKIASRFQGLRKQNKDIVGWLTIDNLLDEPVVRRNNIFYLNHDVDGRENVNGALFLDSAVTLKTRPYALIIYGHNMKSGAMFGCLRNFANISFYHRSPFITFDSMYENGRYVVFAESTISMVEESRNYLDFFSLLSSDLRERQNAIDTLAGTSSFTCKVDVKPDDQLLLLVTCVGNDDERRIVAARRIRDGESEKDLKKQVARSVSR